MISVQTWVGSKLSFTNPSIIPGSWDPTRRLQVASNPEMIAPRAAQIWNLRKVRFCLILFKQVLPAWQSQWSPVRWCRLWCSCPDLSWCPSRSRKSTHCEAEGWQRLRGQGKREQKEPVWNYNVSRRNIRRTISVSAINTNLSTPY